MTSQRPFDVEYELTRLTQRLRRRSMRIVEQLHPELDYGTYLFFLGICEAPGEVRGADLAESFGVHKSTASRAVSTLVRLGLVEQTPDPLDGRARLLTPAGPALAQLNAARTDVQRRLEELFSGWDADDVAAFTDLLHRYNDAADATLD
ncbi:transcriptional regulator, MarR family [Aeromicrobium marinum DSM 15272]|uniref:Transcriptional regulator, MarR family n=1 Tax=Aeromicrobium marinum DSM 15272 TaxID=585531 RepID=E2S9Z5_9ACTN|nr:MarR family transcriptional regulator [Aeromicrobium marinum]EFQ84069.1 transcriptional regulator, MarR family [Aeromicrobium marinum DSM 15272]